ncbi:MAG: response regulator [Tepidisphaeraceae bacterium]|jgi:putative two-component system response regulator
MRILIVDDDDLSLQILDGVLDEMGYEVDRARDGQEAMEKLQGGEIHIVITDWEMPTMNGMDLCRAIRASDLIGYVYVIMLTSRDEGQQKIDGLNAGADAFLVKPLNSEELVVSLKTAERILSLETRDLTMFALAKLSESRDPETGAHVDRVQSYARAVAQQLSTTDKYRGIVDGEFIRLIHQTSPLHDIGKVAIPDSILLKPGKLSPEEMAIMRTHAAIGSQTLDASHKRFPNVRFLQMARDIALSHHERWDGKGYPDGLKGEQIPLAARIVTIADVYDALTSRRIYREAMSHAMARQYILRERGLHFDPDVVEAFLQIEKQFITIHARFRDDERKRSNEAQQAAVLFAAKQAAVPQARDRVVVVDDDAVTRSMIADFLTAHGFAPASFEDPAKAMESIKQQRPRLIISDWEMPRMDGLELCRRVRAQTRGDYVHFILLTVHAGNEELAQAFDAGVDDFLAKPFEETELMARIRSGLRSAAFHEEVLRQTQGSRQMNEQLISLNSRLESLATTDDLTGLYNRREAIRRLEEQWTTDEGRQRPLEVVILDIDHFKRINDEYGHLAGDQVLREVAQTLRKCVRSTDAVCRIGGEEFLIILPFQTTLEAELCADRCREAVAAKEFEYRGQLLKTTLSAGVAGRRAEMPSCDDLLSEADTALYKAKRGGRNTVQRGRRAPQANPPPKTSAA